MSKLPTIHQSPTDPGFVQAPYPFYERARALGRIVRWADYGLPCAVSYAAVNAILRDRRFGRTPPPEAAVAVPPHLAPFHALEPYSMLELEPPHHTRIRKLVAQAFTQERVAALTPDLATLCHGLIDALPADGPADLVPAFARQLPVAAIARLMGLPAERAADLLAWSGAMVAMYQARRDTGIEAAAVDAAQSFTAFLHDAAEDRAARPGGDLISGLLAAERNGDRLSRDEVVSTCILILNAAQKATAQMLGNAVKTLLETGTPAAALAPDRIEGTVEELIRFDPPLHLFIRHVYEEAEVMGHTFRQGEQVACLLAAANRDPAAWEAPERFDPARPRKAHTSFSAGVHFCLGAPLARLELQTALPILFDRLRGLRLAGVPHYAGTYHFHGLDSLPVRFEARTPGPVRPAGSSST